jgi:hypothetical protein
MYYSQHSHDENRAAIVVMMGLELNQLEDVFSVPKSFMIKEKKRMFYSVTIEYAAVYYGLCCNNWTLMKMIMSKRLVCRFLTGVNVIPILVALPIDDRRMFLTYLERERNILDSYLFNDAFLVYDL